MLTMPFFRHSLTRTSTFLKLKVLSKEHPDYICRLICTLNGLKQAPLAWNRTLIQYLLDLGFESTPLLIHVSTDTMSQASKLLKKRLHEHFKLKDLSCVTRILGITVHFDPDAGTLDLLQPDKIA